MINKNEKRIGKFEISFEYLLDGNHERLSFQNINVLTSKIKYESNLIEVIAECNQFDLIDDFTIIPFYKAIIRKNKKSNMLIFNFIKFEESEELT